MLMRPFSQGVSLLQEDMSVMDDAVLPSLSPACLQRILSERGMAIPAVRGGRGQLDLGPSGDAAHRGSLPTTLEPLPLH